jgi:hypothetical protein
MGQAHLGLDTFHLAEFPDFADIHAMVGVSVAAAAAVVVAVDVVVAAGGDNAVEVDIGIAVVALTDRWQETHFDGKHVLV